MAVGGGGGGVAGGRGRQIRHFPLARAFGHVRERATAPAIEPTTETTGRRQQFGRRQRKFSRGLQSEAIPDRFFFTSLSAPNSRRTKTEKGKVCVAVICSGGGGAGRPSPGGGGGEAPSARTRYRRPNLLPGARPIPETFEKRTKFRFRLRLAFRNENSK